jgi:hypothetical protein
MDRHIENLLSTEIEAIKANMTIDQYNALIDNLLYLKNNPDSIYNRDTYVRIREKILKFFGAE